MIAYSTNFPVFVSLRFLQGIFGGVIIPTGNAILYMSCKKSEYAKVTSIVFLITLVSPAIAPYLGGVLMHYFSYKAIFLINLPICAIVFILGSVVIKQQFQFATSTFDYLGLLLSSASYIIFFILVSTLAKSQWLLSIGLFIGFIILIWLFIKVESLQSVPLINFSYFKQYPFFRQATIIQTFFQMSHFGSFFIIGLYLQLGLGMSPMHAGLVIAMQAVGALIVATGARKLFYKKGAVLPISLGLIGVAIVTPLVLLVNSKTQISFACILLFLRGICSGFIGTPLHTISMLDKELSQKILGRIGSMFNIARQLSISLGICISALAISLSNHFYHFDYMDHSLGYSNSLKLFSGGIICITLFCVIGAIFSFRLDNGEVVLAIKR